MCMCMCMYMCICVFMCLCVSRDDAMQIVRETWVLVVSPVSFRRVGVEQLHQEKQTIRGIGNMLFSTLFSNWKRCKIQGFLRWLSLEQENSTWTNFGVQNWRSLCVFCVVRLCVVFCVSCWCAMCVCVGVGVGVSRWFSLSTLLSVCVFKTPTVCTFKRPLLCTGTTPKCVTTCGRGACTRGDVLDGHTEVCQRATPHTGHTPQTPHALPHTQHHTQHHTDTETERDRERIQRKRDGQDKDTTRWKRREDKTNFLIFFWYFFWRFFFFSPKKEVAKLAPGVCSRNSEQARGEPKKPTNSVVVAKTLDVSQAREEVTPLNLQTKGRYPQIVLGIARNSLLRRVGKEDIPMLCRMSGSKDGICSQERLRFAKAWYKVEVFSKHVNISSGHRTDTFSRRLSHLFENVTTKKGRSLWTAAHIFTW